MCESSCIVYINIFSPSLNLFACSHCFSLFSNTEDFRLLVKTGRAECPSVWLNIKIAKRQTMSSIHKEPLLLTRCVVISPNGWQAYVTGHSVLNPPILMANQFQMHLMESPCWDIECIGNEMSLCWSYSWEIFDHVRQQKENVWCSVINFYAVEFNECSFYKLFVQMTVIC